MMKKKLLLIFVLLCIILTGVLVYWLISLNSDKDKSFSSAIVHSIQAVSEYDCNSSDPYVSPVRFSDLRFYNPDIYAWLFIPGTDISLPLLQHSSDDSFYLSHAPDGSESSSGSLYTEARWSDLMFEKPVSIIYGRRTADRLGTLQRYYSENDSLDRYSDLYVFTPDERLHYRVFCASEFSSIYIPQYYRGFSDQKNISSFISDVLSYHTMIRQAVDGYVADSDDRILVLVTGLSQKEDKRFLVLAELVDETG